MTHGLSAASRAAYRQIDLKFHDLRHEAISRWAEAGVPANLLLEWTGHTNLETLSIYLNKARQKVAAAAMQEAERQNAGSPWASLPGRPAPRGGADAVTEKCLTHAARPLYKEGRRCPGRFPWASASMGSLKEAPHHAHSHCRRRR